MSTVDHLRSRLELSKATYSRSFSKSLFFAVAYLLFCGCVLGQTPDSESGDSSKSWTATTDSKADSGNPTRTFESHEQHGSRTVDVRSLQTRGPDGNFQPYQDIETETVRVNATTVRTTTRTFVRDSDGQKTLFQVAEEESRSFPGGDAKVARTTSNPDANGRLQVIQREIQETQKTGPDAKETKTTVMLPDINGGLAPSMQMQEQQKRSGNTVEIKKTTLLPNGNGSWQVGEVRQSTITNGNKTRSIEERVSRPNSDGTLEEVSRTVKTESESASGDKHDTAETYSIDVPGAARDSNLHLVQRVTTSQHSTGDGQKTTELVERPNPGDPGAGLVVSTINTDSVSSGPSGAEAIRTIQIRDANGSVGVVSVDTTKSDSASAIQVQIAPSKPK